MSVHYEVAGSHIPESLKRHEHWVLWGLDEQGRKRPLAPWLRDDLYPVKWGSDAPERPETDWETAYRCWKHRETYSAPSGMDVSEVMPAPLLLHNPLDPPLMQVDFDDVRDDDGMVSDEVAELVDRLGGFCEVSQSGEGLHVFVRAELPGGLGKFIADLEDVGEIELYDHGRAVGATWDHVAGTPTVVPEAQDVVEDIVTAYEDSDQRSRRLGSQAGSGGQSDATVNIGGEDPVTGDDDSKRSPYFDIGIEAVADTGEFRRYRDEAPGNRNSGPHPSHGPVSSDPDECTNFGIEPGSDVWHCFAHEAGGRAIELAAVLCDETDISCSTVPNNAAQTGWLRDRPADLLATCLWLRDEGAVADDARPPYDALLAVAQLADLHIRDPDAGILGETNAEVARAVYDDLESGNIS